MRSLARTAFMLCIANAVALVGCTESAAPGNAASNDVPAINGDAVKAHVELLSDDLYEGREAGKRGYQLAAKYVATQFRTLGLRPGNGDNYFQTVEFRAASIVPGSRRLAISSAAGEQVFKVFDEFTISANTGDASVAISAPLVFVGYGVNAPSIERNDFEHIDLNGKIAVVVSGAPAALGSEVRAFYRSGRYHKSIELEKHGAIGAIYLQHRQISSDAAAVRGSKAEKYWTIDEHDQPKYAFPGLRSEAYLLEAGARRLFAESPVSFEDMAAAIENETYAPMELGISATISHRVSERTLTGDNVIAILEGSDPQLKNEFVVLSAHLDGVGMGDEPDDNIYNGFYDNASGIGTMLEVARVLANYAVRPKRSILFIATVGEEKGLLGADYFASNPTVPVASMVANVNMDMVMFLWPAQDVVAFGAEHSTLLQTVRIATEKTGLELSPDPFPERGYFTRSDQFPFVQRGIPAVFFATGFKTTEAGTDAEALYNDFMQTHYHGATDDRNLRFDTDSAGRVATANAMIALAIANAPERPKWQKNDFFGDLYGSALTRSQ
ncbi:MAG: M28 family peptidase [Gammaproteobacteria bacterium]|nr:M28 family peptidase [Gammaproteobacteria bacterium]MDH5302497.1 M28 family peptidase [Gammaproteobacteria bacterium]MDH5321379.1 M28 family peptidase [Gammaproteobacteria bacterium]